MNEFKDPSYPEFEEIRVWAKNPDAAYPFADFDLAMMIRLNEEQLFELCDSNTYVQYAEFLSLLYSKIETAINNDFETLSEERVMNILEKIEASSEPAISKIGDLIKPKLELKRQGI